VDKSTAKIIDIIELADPVIDLGLNGRIGGSKKRQRREIYGL
jgi:hypothetical protein